MANAKKVAPEFNLLNSEMVSAVQSTADGIIQSSESASEIGAMLHDAGYTPAMLDKSSDKVNAVLVQEVTTAIMYAPRFSAHDRELILNAEAGKTLKSNADKAAVHLGRSYIRKVFAAVRRGIEKAVLAELNGPAERLGLHAKLAKILESGISMIRKDDGKNGAPIDALMAAWKDCAAKTNTAFKGNVIK
jgi:hypothetical protein